MSGRRELFGSVVLTTNHHILGILNTSPMLNLALLNVEDEDCVALDHGSMLRVVEVTGMRAQHSIKEV